MNISIDDQGYVQVDTSFSPGNIDSLSNKMQEILNRVRALNFEQVEKMGEALYSVHQNFDSFEQFIDQWNDVLDEVM